MSVAQLTDPIPGLHTTGTTGLLQFTDIIMANPHQYKDIKLQAAVLGDTGVDVRHESIVFQFLGHSTDGKPTFLYVVGERVTTQQPQGDNTTNNAPVVRTTLRAPALTRSRSLSPLRRVTSGSSDSFPDLKRSSLALDTLRRWEPTQSEKWWHRALGATDHPLDLKIAEFDFRGAGQELTLVDVVLAMRSANLASPNYILIKYNCWWFARSVLLLLQLYHHHPQSPDERQQDIVRYFEQAPTPRIRIGLELTDQVIEDDVQVTMKSFLELQKTVQTTLADHRSAEDRVSEAQREAAEAQREVAEAQREVVEAQREVAEAQREAVEAQREVAEAQRLAAEAQRDNDWLRQRLLAMGIDPRQLV